MVRALGIAAGVLSLTILAWKGFNLAFGPTLLAGLGYLESEASAAFRPLELIIVDVFGRVLPGLGADVHLQPHWKHAFVLMWLFLGAFGHSFSSSGNWGKSLLVWLWSGFVALAAGATSGTVGLDSPAILLLPLISFGVFNLGLGVWEATFFRDASQTWLDDVASEGLVFAFWFGGLAVAGILVDKLRFPFAPTLPSPGLAWLIAAAILFAGVCLIGSSISSVGRDPGWRMSDRIARNARSVFFVVAGAGFVALLGTMSGA